MQTRQWCAVSLHGPVSGSWRLQALLRVRFLSLCIQSSHRFFVLLTFYEYFETSARSWWFFLVTSAALLPLPPAALLCIFFQGCFPLLLYHFHWRSFNWVCLPSIRVSILLAAYWSQQYQLVCLQCQLSTGEYHGIKQSLFHPLEFSMWKRWTLKWLQFNCFVPLFSFEWAPLMVAAGLQLAMEIRCKWSGWTLWDILFCHREMNTEAIHMCDTWRFIPYLKSCIRAILTYVNMCWGQ